MLAAVTVLLCLLVASSDGVAAVLIVLGCSRVAVLDPFLRWLCAAVIMKVTVLRPLSHCVTVALTAVRTQGMLR